MTPPNRPNSVGLDDALMPALQQRQQAHLYRQRLQLDAAQQPHTVMNGEPCLNFSSNDYLGLANHPEVIAAMQRAAQEFGVGSGASHLVSGHSRYHHQLEEALAELTGRPRALLYSTGYMANLGVITALLDKRDAVFEDKLNHASLLDGGLLSGARFQRFLHNDLDNLEARLQRSDARRKLIVVDGVFSMDGDLAPLSELSDLAAQYNAWLMVDDAHGIGVLGEQGGGCVEQFGLTVDQLPILMGTLGKGLGTFGAFVAGSEALIETLIQFSRPYIYTTAMPPAVAAATLASLQVSRREEWRRKHLQQLIARFRQGAEQLGLSLMESSTAIQPVLVGPSERVVAIGNRLAKQGIRVGAIRPPTVAEGTARLRITLTASHTEADVDQLLSALELAVVEQVVERVGERT